MEDVRSGFTGMPRSAVNEIRGISFAEMPSTRSSCSTSTRGCGATCGWTGDSSRKTWIKVEGRIPRWYGYSVGHWDGDDTLVIDTDGIRTRSEWLDPRGYPGTALQGVFEEALCALWIAIIWR